MTTKNELYFSHYFVNIAELYTAVIQLEGLTVVYDVDQFSPVDRRDISRKQPTI